MPKLNGFLSDLVAGKTVIFEVMVEKCEVLINIRVMVESADFRAVSTSSMSKLYGFLSDLFAGKTV